MKKLIFTTGIIFCINMGISQSSYFYLKGYVNPVSTQINNSFNKSVYEIDKDNVGVNFYETNRFPEVGVSLGYEHNKNLFELGINYSQYKYLFDVNTNFNFQGNQINKRSISVNNIGARLSYGRILKWNTSVNLLAEISIPIKSSVSFEEKRNSTYSSLNYSLKQKEQFSSSVNGVFLTPEIYFNTFLNDAIYLRYGLKLHPLDPLTLYTNTIEVTDPNGNVSNALDIRLGHEQTFLYLGIGVKLNQKVLKQKAISK